MLAILAPGQGSQRQGFLSPWLEVDGADQTIAQYADAAAVDLLAAGTTMSDADITDTAVAQPLIVAASLLTAAALPALPASTVIAGHSVGEFAAAHLAGVIGATDSVHLVAIRGAAMAAASVAPPGGMVAILGGDAEEVLAAVADAGCVIANHNGAGQLVAAGRQAALERLLAAPPAGARMRPLAVAGAFHTELMEPARETLEQAVAAVRLRDGRHGLVSNADGTLLTDGDEIGRRLVAQVCTPVRWDACLRTLTHLGVTATIELAPAGTLTALVRRAMPGITALALRGPDDVPTARELIAEHATEFAGADLPWRLLLAPTRGTVRLGSATPHSPLLPTELIAEIATRATDGVAVRATQAGQLIEWLVHDGDPVSEGQPLARVTAEAAAEVGA